MFRHWNNGNDDLVRIIEDLFRPIVLYILLLSTVMFFIIVKTYIPEVAIYNRVNRMESNTKSEKMRTMKISESNILFLESMCAKNESYNTAISKLIKSAKVAKHQVKELIA